MSKHPPLYAWNNYHCTKTGTADSLKQELLDYGFSTMPIESTTTGVFKVTTTIKPSFAPVAADVNSLVGLKAYKYYGPTTTYESSTISEAVLAEMSIVEIPNPCKVKLAYVELLSHSNSSYSYKYILNTASVISFVREGPINSDYTDTFYLKLFPESTSYVYKFLRQDISTKRVVTQTYNLSFTKATIGYSATLTLDDPYASNIIVLGVNGQQFKTYAATAVSGRTITISAADPISSSSYAIADIITIGYKCDSTSLFYRGEQYYNNGVEVVYIHNGLYHLEDNDLFAGALLTTSNNTDVITPSAN